jgi:hypothetical protein
VISAQKSELLLALKIELSEVYERELGTRELGLRDVEVLDMFLLNGKEFIVDDGKYKMSATTFRRFCNLESISALKDLSLEYREEFEEGEMRVWISGEMVNVLLMRFENSVILNTGGVDFKWVSAELTEQMLSSECGKKMGRENFKMLTKEKLSGERVLLPVQEASHWFLMEILKSRKRVHYYDPKYGYLRSGYVESVFQRIMEILNFLDLVEEGESWELETVDCLQQENNVDCGVFAVYFAAQRMLNCWDMKTVINAKSLRMKFAKGLLWSSMFDICIF